MRRLSIKTREIIVYTCIGILCLALAVAIAESIALIEFEKSLLWEI